MTTATLATTERYVEFITLVATSPELSSQMEAINDSEGMVKLAAANGYAFTTDELKSSAHQVRVQMDQNELSDDQLEEVAGGLSILGAIKKGVHAIRKVIDKIDDALNG